MLPAESWTWTGRVLLGAVLLQAGTAKLRDLPAFVRLAIAYDLGPHRRVRPLARALPFAELGLAVLLLADVAVRQAALGALELFVLFALAVTVNLRRGRRILCGCGGAFSEERIGPATLLRLALLAVLSWGVAFGPQHDSLLPPTATPAAVAIHASLLIGGAVLLTLPRRLEDWIGSLEPRVRRRYHDAAALAGPAAPDGVERQ
jgi:uncharacterized membrane protein YphA (DoxX/SURF4 family)